mmetsp:Transcript_12832/g.34120  ORF Transcript_12832/g.34120 Transcript_12832/m.34120 type:complete len:361 (+) Transcript_12832:254-1336(+)
MVWLHHALVCDRDREQRQRAVVGREAQADPDHLQGGLRILRRLAPVPACQDSWSRAKPGALPGQAPPGVHGQVRARGRVLHPAADRLCWDRPPRGSARDIPRGRGAKGDGDERHRAQAEDGGRRKARRRLRLDEGARQAQFPWRRAGPRLRRGVDRPVGRQAGRARRGRLLEQDPCPVDVLPHCWPHGKPWEVHAPSGGPPPVHGRNQGHVPLADRPQVRREGADRERAQRGRGDCVAGRRGLLHEPGPAAMDRRGDQEGGEAEAQAHSCQDRVALMAFRELQPPAFLQLRSCLRQRYEICRDGVAYEVLHASTGCCSRGFPQGLGKHVGAGSDCHEYGVQPGSERHCRLCGLPPEATVR